MKVTTVELNRAEETYRVETEGGNAIGIVFKGEEGWNAEFNGRTIARNCVTRGAAARRVRDRYVDSDPLLSRL